VLCLAAGRLGYGLYGLGVHGAGVEHTAGIHSQGIVGCWGVEVSAARVRESVKPTLAKYMSCLVECRVAWVGGGGLEGSAGLTKWQ
jgi:hypothetical protein